MNSKTARIRLPSYHDVMEGVFAEVRAYAANSLEDADFADAVWQRKRELPIGIVDHPLDGSKAKGFISKFEAAARLHPTRARNAAKRHKKSWVKAASSLSNKFKDGAFYAFSVGTSVPFHESWDVGTSKLVFKAVLDLLGERRENLNRVCKRFEITRVGHSTHLSLKPWVDESGVEVHGNYVLPKYPPGVAPSVKAWIHGHFLFYSPKVLSGEEIVALKHGIEAQFGGNFVVSHSSAEKNRLFARRKPDVDGLIHYFLHYPLSVPTDKMGQAAHGDLRTFVDWHPRILAGFVLAAAGRRLNELARGFQKSLPASPKKSPKGKKTPANKPPKPKVVPTNQVVSVRPTATGIRVVVLNPDSLPAAFDAAANVAPKPAPRPPPHLPS